MIKLVTVFTILLFLSCASVIELGPRRGFHSGGQGITHPVMDVIESDSLGTNIGLNPYLQGYNDGMITAKNESFGGCLVGSCFIGAAGVAAGVYAPSLLFGDPYGYSETTQTMIVILSLVGGIAAGVGSIYLANDIFKVPVPDPMVDDTLYRKGFKEGYRVTYKSQRLRESLKGTALGVGTACAGVAAITLFLIALLASMWGGY